MWIRVARRPGAVVEGDVSCSVGHRLQLPDGATDGVFAGWRWDGQTLHVEHDRFGFYPLFEWKDGDATVLSTHLTELIEHGAPRTLDLDALSVFLRVGFFVGADTPFSSIRALVPSIPPRRSLQITRDEAIDSFIELFRQAISRRAPGGRFVMPLSGGRDSRHILFALHQAGSAPDACVTVRHFPPRANDDELIAREICDALRIRHEAVDQPYNQGEVERRKNRLTHLCTDEHAQFVVLAEYLHTHTRETYDGIAGDVLSQSSYLRPEIDQKFKAGDLNGVVDFVLDGYGTMMTERALTRVLAPNLYAKVPRERAVARLLKEVALYADAPNPTSAFFFANRTRREIALSPFGLMRDVTVFAPYLDRDLYDFLAALPSSLLMDRTLHTEAIARAWPQHAHLPYERKGLSVQDRWAQRRFASALMAATLRKGADAIFRRPSLLPPLVATIVDGLPTRLWHASLVLYLAQIAELANGVSGAPARER